MLLQLKLIISKKSLKSIILFAIILLLLGCSNQEKENDWVKSGLKGQVKTYTEFSYKAEKRFGKIEKGKLDKRIDVFHDFKKTYNEKGHQVQYDQYDSDGSLEAKSTYKYDENGNRIVINSYEPDGSLYSKKTFKYDNKGVRIESNRYNKDGSLKEKTTYKYDKKGNKIESNTYKSDGSMYEKKTYKYDDKGNKIETNKYSANGDLNYRWKYKYDEKGNKIESKMYRSKMFGSTMNLIDTDKYDEKGNKVETKKYDPYGNLKIRLTYKYEYDEQLNWVKRIEFENKTPAYILERDFEYYK